MDKRFRQNLRDAYEYPNFDAVKLYKDQVIEKWRKQNVIGDTEFDTLKKSFEREYKIMGLEDFFSEIEQELYDDEHERI